MVLGFLIGLVTFPGVILHEYAHAKLCKYVGVDVHEVVYLRLGNPMGYVSHGEVNSFKQSFGITAAPFLINTVAALALYILLGVFLSLTGFFETDVETMSTVYQLGIVVFIWLPFSFAVHALPSSQDAKNLWNFSRNANNLSAKIGLPISGFIYFLDKLRFFWIDVIYALVLWGLTGYLLAPIL